MACEAKHRECGFGSSPCEAVAAASVERGEATTFGRRRGVNRLSIKRQLYVRRRVLDIRPPADQAISAFQYPPVGLFWDLANVRYDHVVKKLVGIGEGAE